jgi:hypothetical protein
MSELTTTAEHKALEAAQYNAFRGIDLRLIKTRVAEMLVQIGKHGIFDQYTRHDISHINQLLKSLEWIIPASTAERMKPGDWLMLVLSVYFHDLGMVVTKDEYEGRYSSGFAAYRKYIMENSSAEFLDKVEKLQEQEQDKFLYQEFVRSNHAKRIKNWLVGTNDLSLGKTNIISEEIRKLFSNLDEIFRTDLGKICESHHENDLDDFSKYEIEKFYGNDPKEHVNLHYCAILLRTADLLHITSDRTPSVEYRLINPSDPISQDEWVKQMAVKNVGPKKMRDEDGNVDLTRQSNTVEITAAFKGTIGANGFFGLSSYIAYARRELKSNYDWTQKAIKSEGSSFEFPWNKIDDSKLSTEGFEPKLFEFNLDQHKILQLLVGHTLYNDSTVVIRELIQNSIDAIKLQDYIMQRKSGSPLAGKIIIKWNSTSRILSFIDNGTGMTQYVMEEHLLKVGSSHYQSESFKKNYPDFFSISRFGIGILTCFLVADNVEIITNHSEEPKAKKLTIRNVSGKYLLQYLEKNEVDNHIRAHGTTINLEVRADITLDDLLEQINKWVVFPSCSVVLQVDDKSEVLIGFNSPKNAIEHYLKREKYDIDETNIKVESSSLNGVEMAYAMRFDNHYKEWILMTRATREDEEDGFGTCIEGIRVKFDSPGYNNQNLIAIVNASGQYAPKTNVARSNIESINGDNFYLSSIYRIYVNYLKQEIIKLQEQYSFSLSWAASEIKYLVAPLMLGSVSRVPNSMENAKLFFKELDTAELVLAEVNGERALLSVEHLSKIENIWTVDCNLFQSIEIILRETKNSPSLLELVDSFSQKGIDKISHLSNLLCNYDYTDVIHDRVTNARSVSEVRIFPIDRRVDVCWSKGKKNWYGMKGVLDSRDSYRGRTTTAVFYIQNADYDMDLQGQDSITAISCFNLIFILKGSPIWNYLSSVYKLVDFKKRQDDVTNFGLLLSFITSAFIYGSSVEPINSEDLAIRFSRYQDQNIHNISDEFWTRFRYTDFLAALVDTKWNVFTPSAWKRSQVYDFEQEF